VYSTGAIKLGYDDNDDELTMMTMMMMLMIMMVGESHIELSTV